MREIGIDLDVHRAIEAARQSFEETPNGILRRLLGIDAPAVQRPRQRSPRSSGAYSTLFGGVPLEANSLKQLLAKAILAAEERQPGFIEALSRQPTPKGRYIVARSADGLYPRTPQLVVYAERLDASWWFDTNVGKAQVTAYLARFARLLGFSLLPRIEKRSQTTGLPLA
jgi:hypothetical protein